MTRTQSASRFGEYLVPQEPGCRECLRLCDEWVYLVPVYILVSNLLELTQIY